MNKLVLYNKKNWLKSKLKMVSFSLAFSTFISGCTVNGNANEDTNSNKINTVDVNSNSNEQQSPNNRSFDDDSLTFDDYTYDDAINDIKLLSEFELNSDEVNHIINEIKKIDVNYEKSDLFEIDENLTRYNKVIVNSYDNSLGIIENNKVNCDLLYKTVLGNNREYRNGHGSSFYNTDISDELLSRIIEIIASNIDKKLSSDNYINISELNYTLTNLKIFTYNGFGAGGVDNQEDILSIDMNTIENYRKLYPDIDPLEMTVKHECNHLIQAMPQINTNNYTFSSNYGFCYKFDDNSINSLYNSWIFEAASEKMVLNDYDDGRKPLVYDYYINALEALSLSTILLDDTTSVKIENLTFQHNLDLFLEQFGAKNDSEKKEILKMLYSFELINTNGKEFSDNYKEKYGQDLDLYAMGDYCLSLKGSVSLTLSKVFYTNLLTNMENKSVKIEDIYQLISIFEDEISRITWYSSRNDFFPEFIKNYQKIQMFLFEKIAEKTNLSTDEVVSYYNNYHKNLEVYHNISWLNADKNGFLSNMLLTRRNHRKESIIEIYYKNFSYSTK